MSPPQCVRPSPYPSALLDACDVMCVTMTSLCRASMEGLFSCFIPITTEWDRPLCFCLRSLVKGPIYLVLFLLTIPLAIVGTLVYMFIAGKREKYRLSYIKNAEEDIQLKSHYGFTTINMCCHYEFVSRINNMRDYNGRAREMAQRILQSQLKYTTSDSRNGYDSHHIDEHGDRSDMDVDIKTTFPLTDVLLLQEVAFPETAELLADILHTVYPYAVYDACDHGWSKNLMLSGGDVMILSKNPILHARFNRYTARCGYDLMTSKGLLQAKLDLGEVNGIRQVGLVATSHLQVYQNDDTVRTRQLNDIVNWTQEYRKSAVQDREHIVFDVVGGDFNMANTAPVDEVDWDHPIFRVYHDSCREAPGKDKPFARGTEVRQPNLYDPAVMCPSRMRAAMLDPSMRRRHFLDGDMADMSIALMWVQPPEDPSTGRTVATPLGGRRRVDYVLTRKEDHVETRSCNAVTQLAGLTDHVPYYLGITVT